ncbi:uncharacterized protein LOC134221840, partial [Armigeres subalbatus]|uniref:uncharacterized protein LOC134221840 n=1 Tax=Armigeres subalbatus TaxID=124917 RepID=UPI002ED28D91
MSMLEHFGVDTHAVFQARLINRIAMTYFLGAYSICNVVNRTDVSVNTSFNNVPIIVVQSHDLMLPAINLGCSVFIIDEDSVFWFLNNFIALHDAAEYRHHTKYVVIMLNSGCIDKTATLNDIQSHPVVHELPNLLLVITKNYEFELLTHYYTGNGPESVEYHLLDVYNAANNSFLYGNYLFPDKLINLLGKASRVASFHVVPWFIMRPEVNGVVRYRNQSYITDGLDGYLLTQFCLRYNCTWELHVDQKNRYGEIFENGTGNGLFGALLDRKVDLAIGAVGGYFGAIQYFSLSHSLQRVGITCLVPKPQLVPHWKLIYLTFSKSVWMALGAVFIAVTFFLYYLNTLFTNQPTHGFLWILFKVLRTFVLTSADLPKNSSAEGAIIASLLMFTIIVGNVYIGRIHSVLAFPPYHAPLATVKDLALSGIGINAEHASWMYSLDISENPQDKILLENFEVIPIEQLTDVINQGRKATMIAVLENGHAMVGSWINAHNVELYRIMKESLYVEFEAGYATKTWPWLDRFNYLSSWIRDAHLSKYIELVEVYRHMDHRVQISIEHSRDRPPSKLKNMNVSEISGAFMLLGIGCATGLVVFLLEIVYH